jgi:hypothetical protein
MHIARNTVTRTTHLTNASPPNSTFTALLGGTPVDSFSAPTSLSQNWFGFTGLLFDQVQITGGGSNGAFLMDNLELNSVPEPATYGMVSSALVGLAVWSRRRKSRLANSRGGSGDSARRALWATHTFGHPGSWLRVQDDGNLALCAPGNNPLWASNTVVPSPPPIAAIEDGQVYKEQSKPEFYLIKGAKKLWIPSMNVLANLGFTTAQVRIVADGRLASIPSLPNLGGPVLEALNMPADDGKVKPSDLFLGPFKVPRLEPLNIRTRTHVPVEKDLVGWAGRLGLAKIIEDKRFDVVAVLVVLFGANTLCPDLARLGPTMNS